jgi:hypothetical protein
MEVGNASDISFMEEIFYKIRKYFLYGRNSIDGENGFLNL